MQADQGTSLGLYGAAFLAVAGALLTMLPRRHAVIPVIPFAMIGCYLTVDQGLDMASLHLTGLRLLIMAGWVRILLRGEYAEMKLTPLDVGLLVWGCTSALIHNLGWQTWAAFINQMGFLYDTFGSYFLFRCLIRSRVEAVRALKGLSLMIIPLAVAMMVEYATGRNLFAALGSIPEFSEVREGRVRAQGSFEHPILAGTFGATLLPLLAGAMIREKAGRLVMAAGMAAAAVIAFASSSSGPVMTALAGMAALAAWPLRRSMRLMRWGVVIGIGLVQLVMKAPVWYLMARVGDVTGGTGWHRAELIDQAISHLDEWWLAGTGYTAHWMPNVLESNPDMADITNQYIRAGLDGGLLSMILFIVVLYLAFASVGRSVAEAGRNGLPRSQVIFIWGIGCALFAHAVTFMSVSYFDQIIVFWYFLLALVPAVATGAETAAAAQPLGRLYRLHRLRPAQRPAAALCRRQ